MKPRRTPNPKRRIRSKPEKPEELARLDQLSKAVGYGGNPEHKRNPGDFGLPLIGRRQGKSLCDDAGILTRKEAKRLLREGVRRGVVSVQERNGWPQNVWAVSDGGHVVEAMLENSELGTYHGYKLPDSDPFAGDVLARWRDH